MATLCILITFLCFHYVVTHASTYTAGILGLSQKTFLAHYVSPLLVILDWLLFDEKGKLPWAAPVYWLFAPLIYVTGIMLRALLHGPARFSREGGYPYFFLDIERVGGKIYIYLGIYLIFFLVIGYLFLAADWLLARLGRSDRRF